MTNRGSNDPPRQASWTSGDEGDTLRFASAMAAQLTVGDVVALHGELGAGKTRFVRGLAEGLGLEPRVVTSPTFTICQEYPTPAGAALVHVDAWRLSGPEELESIGWDELCAREDAILAVEWAERIEARLPEGRIEVLLEPIDESVRRITVRGPSRFIEAMRTVSPIPAAATVPDHCPICGQPMPTAGEGGLFCSERCRLADLGRWFTGSYRVARPIHEDDLGEEDWAGANR
ncbi:MAG: tRNA (adenosine(37)-N6)-threonylcarbamoyltransferase complex ATPase subunit type 1 TsaE [Phycisphaerales bacterium]|nr:tRNA (adenosine(37)-N6)-threonylcarbamoyltransferase complex ATPase subunit type 1 TsaE [Phycisphaerales bacterium]